MYRVVHKPFKIAATLLAGALLGFLTYFITPNLVSHAASATNWQAGNIIADGVFYNGNDMTVDQIQQFLNTRIAAAGGCDTWGTQPSEYGGGTRAQYGTSQGYAPPYICLANYYENPSTHTNNLGTGVTPDGAISAAQIIKNAATTYNISARALLVIIEKESPGPLLDDTWPFPPQYTNALGYGCPDTAPCDPQYAGFYNQVMNAARQFQLYKQNYSSYRIQANTSDAIAYNPTASCGSSDVYVKTNATAGLYNYTPYQPNQAALTNLYGTGDSCSAYGNRNFWRIFTDWFGSTQTNTPYAWSDVGNPSYTDSSRTQQFTGSSINIQPGQNAYITILAQNIGTQTWQQNVVHLGTADPHDRNSLLADESWLSPARIQMQETSVVPGDHATFTFDFKAPQQPGTYHEHLSLVADGITWMNDPGLIFTINVVIPQQPIANTRDTLITGQGVTESNYLLSSDTQSVLHIENGNVILSSGFQTTWQTNTSGNVSGLFMQSDGNLVLYSTDGKALWNSGTSGYSGATLALQQDGNLVIYSQTGTPLWASGTSSVPSYLMRADYTLSNSTLYPGQSLVTPDGRYRMVLQSDGNLVVYSQTGTPLWASGTSGQSIALLAMQSDGNLVLYRTDGKAAWFTRTGGNGPSTLSMQQDGNLVIYASNGSATWNTRTSGLF